MSLAHQQRVIDEKAALDEKIAALHKFLYFNPIFETISTEERKWLRLQRDVMLRYSYILEKRIELFPVIPR